MNSILFSQLPQISGGKLLQLAEDLEIHDLITDSRKANPTKNSVFFAIGGVHLDGHQFIIDLYKSGCRNFVVEREVNLEKLKGANFIWCKSSLKALQNIASTHRQGFKIPVIGITGSNGKTIVKEWLYNLLSKDYSIAKSPGSYNSQLGVPLSVWKLSDYNTLGIFEAGISKPAEMNSLQKIIQPTIGVFTNVLTAHDEGFESRTAKAREKSILFDDSEVMIYCKQHSLIDEVLTEKHSSQKLFTWGDASANVLISKLNAHRYKIQYQDRSIEIEQDFSDSASWENLFHCIATMLYLGFNLVEIKVRAAALKPLSMRLEMKAGINGSILIDDSYSNDLASLSIALDFFSSQRSGTGVVILSDMLESGLSNDEWIQNVNKLLSHHKIDKLVTIGSALLNSKSLLTIESENYITVEDCINQIDLNEFANSTILVKGARAFKLEKIVQQFQRKIHGTVMEINLNSIVHNLNVYRSRLNPGTKIMAMVKAFAYGSGSNEVASVLQYHKVDYLGVAYADEGKWLRSKSIHLPIMVMNPASENFSTLVEYSLEPSIYSISILRQLLDFLNGKSLNVHLKFDTGMHRLGFEASELPELVRLLQENPGIRVQSVYSHLAGSDDATHDDFTAQQVDRFQKIIDSLSHTITYPFLKHILNSAGISRLSQYQFDMVRLGIGMYGIDPGNEINQQLKPAVTLKTTISQIKSVSKEETVGYGRHGKSKSNMKIATISIGYADGYSRAFSKGVGKVLVNGNLAPVIGNVCMDMTMINISDIPAQEGDEVMVFGENLSIVDLANWSHTIPYEILTNTSDRVKRVFFAESI